MNEILTSVSLPAIITVRRAEGTSQKTGEKERRWFMGWYVEVSIPDCAYAGIRVDEYFRTRAGAVKAGRKALREWAARRALAAVGQTSS